MDTNKEYVRRIINAVNMIDGIYDVGARYQGVKANTLTLLYALDDGELHTQKSISEEWLLPRTTLNTIIKECEAEGYITLKPVPGHKRDLHICLTEEGKTFAQKVLAHVYEAEEQAIVRTLQECSPSFIDYFEKFCRNLQAAFQKAGMLPCQKQTPKNC